MAFLAPLRAAVLRHLDGGRGSITAEQARASARTTEHAAVRYLGKLEREGVLRWSERKEAWMPALGFVEWSKQTPATNSGGNSRRYLTKRLVEDRTPLDDMVVRSVVRALRGDRPRRVVARSAQCSAQHLKAIELGIKRPSLRLERRLLRVLNGA